MTITPEAPEDSSGVTEPARSFASISPRNFERLDNLQSLVKPVENSFSLNFGPQILQLKASYLEKRENAADMAPGSAAPSLRRYLNLLGTTSFGGTGIIGEGELAYSPSSSLLDQCACPEWPRMMRLGIRSRWQGLSYGADVRSVERGFVALTDNTTFQTRDEGQVWGEYNLGPFNLRGSLGQSWEELLDSNRQRTTRTAMTSIKLNRAVWGGSFSSTYGLVEQGAGLNQEATVLTNTLTGFYRPISTLSLGPSFAFKQEWDVNTGARTETPTTDFSFVYNPFQDQFRLMGGTSFSRTINRFGLNDVTTLGTRAIIDWRLGKFLGRNDTLSFNVNYNRQRDAIFSGNSHEDVSGILQLKITGF